MLTKSQPERAAKLLELARADVQSRWQNYAQLAGISTNGNDTGKAKRKGRNGEAGPERDADRENSADREAA
jgi:hypothetical protein